MNRTLHTAALLALWLVISQSLLVVHDAAHALLDVGDQSCELCSSSGGGDVATAASAPILLKHPAAEAVPLARPAVRRAAAGQPPIRGPPENSASLTA